MNRQFISSKGPVFIAGLLVFINSVSFGQINQKYSDSLKAVLSESEQLSDSQRLVILDKISRRDSDPETIIRYGTQLLELSKSLGLVKNQQMAELYIGNGYKYLGDLNLAIQHYYRSASLADSIGDRKALGSVYGSIGNLHRQNKNFSGSIKFHSQSLEIFKSLSDTLNIAITIFNLGNTYDQQGLLDSAILCYERCSKLAKHIDHKMLNAYSVGNKALINIRRDHSDEAEKELRSVLKTLDELGDQYGIADYLWQLSDLYSTQGNVDLAIKTSLESLNMAMEIGLKEQIRDASFKLYQLYKDSKQFDHALHNHELYLIYKDSITNMTSVQEMANLRTEFEVGQKQAEVDLLTAEKKINQLMLVAAIAFSLIVIVLAAIIFKYYRDKKPGGENPGASKAGTRARQPDQRPLFSQSSHTTFVARSHLSLGSAG